APAVTDNPKGSRQSCRTMRPGCTGFFIGMVCFPFSLMVIDHFDVKGVQSKPDGSAERIRLSRERHERAGASWDGAGRASSAAPPSQDECLKERSSGQAARAGARLD